MIDTATQHRTTDPACKHHKGNLGGHNDRGRSCPTCVPALPSSVDSSPMAWIVRFTKDEDRVTEVRIGVMGGRSHNARVEAATGRLELFTEFASGPVTISSYEVFDRGEFVEFRYF